MPVRRLPYCLIVGVIVAVVMALVVLTGEGIDAYYRSRLVDMVHGTAYRPYVYRVLVPGSARLGTLLIPSRAKLWLSNALLTWSWRPDGWDPAYASEYLLVLLVMTLSLVGFASATRALFQAVFISRPFEASATAVVSLAAVPIFFGPFSRQIYDFTTLWLFTWGLVLIARARWPAFVVLFPFACLNKETAVLLTLVLVIGRLRHPEAWFGPTFRRLLAYQVVVFLIVRVGLLYVFRSNPGSTVEVHLFDHNQQVLLHPSWISKRLLLAVGATLIGVWGWDRKPAFLQDALLALAPVLIVMGLTVGQVDEIRAYYELYSVVVLLIADTFFRLFHAPLSPVPGAGTTAPGPFDAVVMPS
jgi:hypothetical protein